MIPKTVHFCFVMQFDTNLDSKFSFYECNGGELLCRETPVARKVSLGAASHSMPCAKKSQLHRRSNKGAQRGFICPKALYSGSRVAGNQGSFLL
jgi:hypothetical protein